MSVEVGWGWASWRRGFLGLQDQQRDSPPWVFVHAGLLTAPSRAVGDVGQESGPLDTSAVAEFMLLPLPHSCPSVFWVYNQHAFLSVC